MWAYLGHDFQHKLLLIGFVLIALVPVELTISHERRSLASRAMPAIFWVLWAVAGTLTLPILATISPAHSLYTIPMAKWGWFYDGLVAPVLAAILADFYFYFHHRIQHAVPLLWRFHAVHHSIRELNAINMNHHPLDDLIRGTISLIPLTLISVEPTQALPGLAAIFTLHPAYLHSPIKLHFGPLRHIFGDNRFHRIHHSTDPKHFDKKFGAFTTLWDRVFGTAYWPAKDEWPEIGLREMDEPKNVREWLTLPWRYPKRWRMEVPAK